MREILFRGKHSEKSMLWNYGDLYVDHDKVYIGMRETMHGVRVYGEVIPDTVGQYTGLTDKNGKKIFEGDIVQFFLITGRSLVPQGLRQVTFSAGSFMIEDPYSGDDETISRIAASVELEVVGNIHDNPDMIADYIQSVRQELMEDE